MDYRLVTVAVAAGVGYEVVAPLLRRLVYCILPLTKHQVQQGKPSVVCSVCGVTTSDFTISGRGGAHCSKCPRDY